MLSELSLTVRRDVGIPISKENARLTSRQLCRC